MLQQIKLNLKRLIKGERAIALLFLLVQLMSVITIFFSYGIINHFNTKVNEVEGISLDYDLGRNVDKHMKKEEIERFYEEIIPVIKNKIDYISIIGYTDERVGMQVSFGYENNEFVASSYLNSIEGNMVEGRMFSDEELNSDEKVAVVGTDILVENNMVRIGEEEYEVVGITGVGPCSDVIFVPFNAMPDNYNRIVNIGINLEKPLLESEYNAMSKAAIRNMGDKVNVPEFDGIKNTSFIRVYNDLILVTVILIVVCALNYCIIYRYILEKRRRSFAISRICGCTRIKAIIIYMVELFLISLFTLLAGVIVYLKFLLPRAAEYFEYIEYYHNASNNMQIIIIYLISLLVVYMGVVIRFVFVEPANLIRGCKG